MKGIKTFCKACRATERLDKGFRTAGNSQPESDAEFINHVNSFSALEKAPKCSNH